MAEGLSEGLNEEVAHHLNESASEEESHRVVQIVEIVEAIVLALVAILTAWSGFQAAQWDGKNALYYEQAIKYHLLATRQTTYAGQLVIYNANTFTAWGAATTEGNTALAAYYSKRFTPDYRVAFDAWLKLDPAHNPKAPPGPAYVSQYHNPAAAKAKQLDNVGDATFDRGTEARHTADEYIRGTVLLATILFLIAIGQRFKVKGVRHALLGVSFVLLGIVVITLATYPRA
jgi:hypothetical protein